MDIYEHCKCNQLLWYRLKHTNSYSTNRWYSNCITPAAVVPTAAVAAAAAVGSTAVVPTAVAMPTKHITCEGELLKPSALFYSGYSDLRARKVRTLGP